LLVYVASVPVTIASWWASWNAETFVATSAQIDPAFSFPIALDGLQAVSMGVAYILRTERDKGLRAYPWVVVFGTAFLSVGANLAAGAIHTGHLTWESAWSATPGLLLALNLHLVYTLRRGRDRAAAAKAIERERQRQEALSAEIERERVEGERARNETLAAERLLLSAEPERSVAGQVGAQMVALSTSNGHRTERSSGRSVRLLAGAERPRGQEAEGCVMDCCRALMAEGRALDSITGALIAERTSLLDNSTTRRHLQAAKHMLRSGAEEKTG
jgi:hypothetical protein